MIEFKGTGFTYDGERFVLDGVDARIERGEFVCVLGGNGSGKSTLAKHVNALLVPDEGSVTVLDRDTRDERSTYFIRSRISWQRIPLTVIERIEGAAHRSKSTSHSHEISVPSCALSLMTMIRSFSLLSSITAEIF